MKKAALLLSILLPMITSCGFHLRGSEALPPQLHHLYLQSDHPYSPLVKQLHQTFNSIGVTVARHSTEAPYTLKIINDDISTTINSISATTQTREYTLTYSVGYAVVDPRGHNVLGPDTVTTTRQYTSNTNEVLGSSNELVSYQRDMQRDVIFLLLNRLSATDSIALLEKYQHETKT